MSFLLGSIFLASVSKSQSQDSIAPLGQEWTLQQCVNYAWTHNLQVKQAALTLNIAKNNFTASKGNLLPSVNGLASHTYNFGRTIDPFTNTFATSEVLSEDFYLQASFTIFGGLQNLNTVKQNEAAFKASGYDLQANKNTLALSIASGYLQVLLDRELLQQARDQHEVTIQQVEKTQKLVDAGSLAKGNLYDVQAQEANDEVNIINTENQLNMAMLGLAQQLDIDSIQLFKIAKPEITISDNPAINSPDLIYSQALTNQPDIFSSRLKWESAEDGRKAAAGALYPKLSVSATLGTGYSGLNKEIVNSTIQGYQVIGFASSQSATPIPIYIPNEVYSYKLTPFSNQLTDNFNKSIGFRLSIPIFNGLQTNMAYKNAKLNAMNAEYNYETTRMNLRKSVQQAYADAEGALKKYYATQKSVESLKEAYNYTRARYDAGAATSLDYNTAKNNLAKAESDLVQAKYTYVFKLKVLDYYEGKPLKL